jgi:UDP:flavonoid glycosyltransferase YjiC (YdhE family)
MQPDRSAVKPKKLILISPPFTSQLSPTLALAGAFHEAGVETTVACGKAFRERITGRGFGFLPLLVNRNANTGIAQATDQPEQERRRLEAFLESTKRGAAAALLQQSRDRREDMFADPEGLLSAIDALDRQEKPDLWVANQLSYAVTLVLHCLGLPFISFCPPHPLTIPRGEKIYGVPAAWPPPIHVDRKEFEELQETARNVERSFTAEFNRFIRRHCGKLRPVANSFRLASGRAVLYNYPDFGGRSDPPGTARSIYMGYCFEEEPLPQRYRELLEGYRKKGPRILIVMGTFLSYRRDVLEACILGAKERFPDSLVIAGAGASTEALSTLHLENVHVEEFVPQKALIPHMDVVIHHGGNNSFTECLFFGRPMVILPFSSDQFDIAADAVNNGIASALDPNTLSSASLGEALEQALQRRDGEALSRWQRHVRGRGPGYAVRKLLSV